MYKSGAIGVVTVTYNSGTVIRDFLNSLLDQSHTNFFLFVVDNASSDNTLAVLSSYSDPRIAIIGNLTNVGVAEANNIGIKAALNAGCATVLLINNDVVFGPDLISQLCEGLAQYQCEMVVPKILYFNPPDRIWCAGGTFSRLRGRSRHFGMGQKDDGRFDQPREVKYSPTCCMLIRREVFEHIGLMDPKYFVYFDDADFCLRAYRAGMRLVYLPTARLYHKVSALIGHRSDLSLRYVTRNHVYYVMKNCTSLSLLYYLPVCQAHILVRLWFAKSKVKAFHIAERAFWEGVGLYCSRQSSTKLQPGAAPGRLGRVLHSPEDISS